MYNDKISSLVIEYDYNQGNNYNNGNNNGNYNNLNKRVKERIVELNKSNAILLHELYFPTINPQKTKDNL